MLMQVPMTIAYNPDLVSVPCASATLVYAYGAYGHSLDISHAPEYEVLLAQGFVIAFAHVRGGGELGRRYAEIPACSQPYPELGDVMGARQSHSPATASFRSMQPD